MSTEKEKNKSKTAPSTANSGELEEAISALSLSIWEIEEGGSELMDLRKEVIQAHPEVKSQLESPPESDGELSENLSPEKLTEKE
jgi:hypothetical protein